MLLDPQFAMVDFTLDGLFKGSLKIGPLQISVFAKYKIYFFLKKIEIIKLQENYVLKMTRLQAIEYYNQFYESPNIITTQQRGLDYEALALNVGLICYIGYLKCSYIANI